MTSTQQQIKDFTTSHDQSNCMIGFFTVQNNWEHLQSEILTPRSCVVYNSTDSNWYIEFDKTDANTERNVFILITTIGILLTLLTVNYRSCSYYRVDWFRLIVLYIIGTLGVVVVVNAGVSTPGFNRLLGFGILVHNFGEAYLLKHVWFGNQGLASFWGVGAAILYLWVMSTFIWLLPINVFFFIAMWQGATFDYFLVYSFPYISTYFKKNQWNRTSWILASVAAVIHITSIQPLFFGMSLAYTTIAAVTAIFLFPTFFFYTLFAIREMGRVAFVGPSYKTVLKGRDLRNNAEMVVELAIIEKGMKDNKKDDGDDTKKDGDNNKPNEGNSIIEELRTLETINQKKLFAKLHPKDIELANEISQVGILKYFKISWTKFSVILACAALTSFGNCCIIFWAPCYIHFRCTGN